MNVKIDPNVYQQRFDMFLEQLRREISDLSRAVPGETNPPADLDNYILALNSFYYKSFAERFCPDYKNALKEDVAALLHLSIQENMIKQDILANLKRYAKLYNQCKKLAAQIENWRLENNQTWQYFNLDVDQHKFELYYALKSIRGSLTALEELVINLKMLSEDPGFIDIIGSAAVPLDLLDIFSYLDADNPIIMEHLNQLLIELRKMLNIPISGLTSDADRQVLKHTLVPELQALAALIGQADPCVSAFYRRNVLEPLFLKSGMLSPNARSMYDFPPGQTIRDFRLYLQNVLNILEKAASFSNCSSRKLFGSAAGLTSLRPEQYDEWTLKLEELVDQINNLSGDLPLDAEADFAYFSGKANDILTLAHNFLNALFDHDISSIGALDLLMEKLENELAYFKLRLDILAAQETHSARISARLGGIDQLLSSYQGLINDIKADLERLLAPRNLSRAWKDLQVKVERVALEKGRTFPAEHLDMLDRYRVETRISEDRSNTILYEEGDIFILRVEDLCEEEVPYLVVSQQAPASSIAD